MRITVWLVPQVMWRALGNKCLGAERSKGSEILSEKVYQFDSVSRVTFSRKGTEILQYLNGGYSGREVRKELKEYTGVEVRQEVMW